MDDLRNYLSNIHLIDENSLTELRNFRIRLKDAFNDLKIKISNIELFDATSQNSGLRLKLEDGFNKIRGQFSNAQHLFQNSAWSFKSKLRNSIKEDDRMQYGFEILKMHYYDYDLFLLNFCTILAFLIDKLLAINGKWRIREINLLFCCLQSPIASILSMHLFNHKINRHPQFYIFSLIGLFIMFKNYDFIHQSTSSFLSWKSLGFINFGFMLLSQLIGF